MSAEGHGVPLARLLARKHIRVFWSSTQSLWSVVSSASAFSVCPLSEKAGKWWRELGSCQLSFYICVMSINFLHMCHVNYLSTYVSCQLTFYICVMSINFLHMCHVS
jgi:hypothetical protein